MTHPQTYYKSHPHKSISIYESYGKVLTTLLIRGLGGFEIKNYRSLKFPLRSFGNLSNSSLEI
jgi:hypothetical protein